MWREELAELVANCDDPDVAMALLDELEPEVQRTERDWLRRVEESLYQSLTSGNISRAVDDALVVHRYIVAGGDDVLPAWKRAVARAKVSPKYTDDLVTEARRRGVMLPSPAAPF